jgi:hypothetical protein
VDFRLDKNFILVVCLIALTFLFILPSWNPLAPKLDIISASSLNGTVGFSASYAVPWQKSCYIVAFGPFVYDRSGHENGNNIFVLTERQGVLSDSLLLQQNEILPSLKLQLWCDNDFLLESEKIFE